MSSKDSRTVRSGGKLGDNIKELPIAIYPGYHCSETWKEKTKIYPPAD